MGEFRYAFQMLDRPHVVKLTLDEFDIFFALSSHKVVQNALAWSEFSVVGNRMRRIELKEGPRDA
jgi:hypothetical protein